MKYLKSNKVLLLLFSVSLLACSGDDDSNSTSNNGQSADQVASFVQSGLWEITSYVDDGVNETSDYAGYTFDFQTNGTLIATNGSVTLQGSWSVQDDSDDSNDDSPSSDDDDFNIFFNVSQDSDFDDLIDDWDIQSSTSTVLSLRDVSGGDGSVDTLVFTRL